MSGALTTSLKIFNHASAGPTPVFAAYWCSERQGRSHVVRSGVQRAITRRHSRAGTPRGRWRIPSAFRMYILTVIRLSSQLSTIAWTLLKMVSILFESSFQYQKGRHLCSTAIRYAFDLEISCHATVQYRLIFRSVAAFSRRRNWWAR